MTLADYDRLLDILQHARIRKQNYFSPISPKVLTSWLSGLHTGLSFIGLPWPPKHRYQVLEKRGLEVLARYNVAELRQRGLSDEAIVDELLAIEIEMWQAQRDDAAKLEAASNLAGIKPLIVHRD